MSYLELFTLFIGSVISVFVARYLCNLLDDIEYEDDDNGWP